jgi:large subunit ribosomal protein L10
VPTPAKEATISGLAESLTNAQGAVLADYRGLTVEEITRLRRRLLPLNARFTVTKNTLLRIALERKGMPDLGTLLEGPSAVLFADGDPAEATKVLLAFVKETRRDIPKVKGGLLGSRVLTTDDVVALSQLPSRDQILATLVGTIQTPIANVVSTVGAVLQNLVGTLEAYHTSKSEAA